MIKRVLIILLFMIQATSYSIAQNLLPDWKTPKGIAIVYPEKLPEHPSEKVKKRELIEFYDFFIQNLVHSDIREVTILHRPGLKEKLAKKFPNNKINLIETRHVQDIWIRDFAPFAMTSDKVFKAFYSPSYISERDKKYAYQDDSVGIELAKLLRLEIIHLTFQNQPFILDGGNFIHNGQGTGITTNRIIADNESLSIEQIRDILKTHLGISKLLILPVEPGDETGHIDGMVRFKDENTVFVGDYPDNYEYKSFMDSLANHLQSDFQVIRIINATPDEQNQNEFPSARGNYINYLRMGNTIFLPQYDNDLAELDKAARQEYEKHFKVIPIDKEVDKLAELGGVLNCITWTYY